MTISTLCRPTNWTPIPSGDQRKPTPWPCVLRQATYLGSVTKSGWNRCMMKSLSLKSLGLWDSGNWYEMFGKFGKSFFRDHQKQNRFWRDGFQALGGKIPLGPSRFSTKSTQWENDEKPWCGRRMNQSSQCSTSPQLIKTIQKVEPCSSI
jgi:hypothetical protein